MLRTRALTAASSALVLSLGACADDPVPTAPIRGVPAPIRASIAPTTAGGRLAFMSRRDGNPEIYVMGLDGAAAQRLTYERTDDLDPAASPDGSRIAFASSRGGGEYDVYVMNADGTGVTRLTASAGSNRYPAWSPDGKRLAFVSTRAGHYEIFVMNADGSAQTQLTRVGAHTGDPAWSPDGSRIAFTKTGAGGTTDIAVMNADGSAMRDVTSTSTGDEQHPSWSPDGSRIAYQSNQHGGFSIFAMNADGTAATRLTGSGMPDTEPAWSPDGASIAFVSMRDGNFELYVMNADGTGQTRLTETSVEELGPTWQRASMPAPTLPQAITFTSTPPASVVIGDFYGVEAVGGGSGNPVVLRSLTPSVCTLPDDATDGAKVSAIDVGTCIVAADQAGGNGYSAAPQETQRTDVRFPFGGFQAPVDAAPVVNTVKAGRGVPVKFSLGGDRGLAIFRAGYPRFVAQPCASIDAQDAIETLSESPGGLSYDARSDQYTYVWKTDSRLAGRCGRLELGLVDSSDQHARFWFSR